MGERGGKREGLRMERNSSSASEGKLDLIRRHVSEEEERKGAGQVGKVGKKEDVGWIYYLGDARGDAFGDFESGSKWRRASSSKGESAENNLSTGSVGAEAIRRVC